MDNYAFTQNGPEIQEILDQVPINESAISTNTSAIGNLANLTTTEKGSLVGAINEVKGNPFPVGSVVCMSTNVNPSTYYNGAWTLIDKKFKTDVYNSTSIAGFVTPSGTNTCDLVAATSENTIEFDLSFKNASDLTDTSQTIANIDLTKCGLTPTLYEYVLHEVGITDTGNGVVMVNFSLNTFNVLAVDAFGFTSGTWGHSVASGSTVYVHFSMTFEPTFMLDSFCDRFYFKRTA